MLKDLDKFSLPELEKKVLRLWRDRQIFKKSLDQNRHTGEKFIFYEGPPTANGQPGIHHVLSRSFKDIVPRFKTMQGFFVPRKAGWDTHGLPVELAVEKELGLKHKSEIEKFGVAEFNTRAKELIWKYRSDWERMSERMGYWLDFDNPYITYDNSYIESVWWLLSQIYKRKYLKKLLKIVPWCPRCQTPLSSHELGQPGAYQLVKDPSLYVKFRLKTPRTSSGVPEFLLVWTTTPWTLPANMAVAVHPKLTYTKYQIKNTTTGQAEHIWSFNPPPQREGYEISVIEKISGKKLIGQKYEPLYPLTSKEVKKIKKLYEVRGAEFVATEEGSGLVHIAPAFGEDDFALIGVKEDLPVTVDEQAKMGKDLPGAGKYVKEADTDILADLEARGLLYQLGQIEHEYPHCWRCNSALIYMARRSWFIEMSRLQDVLLKNNKKINWIPSHIKEGRFGSWLEEVKDWAISRNRYWGTPLPIWECKKCDALHVVGGLSELNKRAFHQNTYYLVRHGESAHNVEQIIAAGPEQGRNIFVLTDKGELQAEKIGKQLKKEEIDIVYASPYRRTQETAQAIAKATGARVITDNRLQEINCGSFNLHPVEAYHAYFSDPLDRFYRKPPGGETLSEVRQRVMQFYQEIDKKYKNKKIAIVSHGDPLWMLDSGLRGLSNEAAMESDYDPPVGSVKKITSHNWPYTAEGLLDLHRPYIDGIRLKCEKCKTEMERIKDVSDVWFDSGAMPYASEHFPFNLLGKTEAVPSLAKANPLFSQLDFPADYIAEGIDQTRGWFYTLHAIAAVLGKGRAYKNVISLGLILDKHGQKMSKSKGNVVDPMAAMEKYGADAIRWFFYTNNDPGEPTRFNEDDIAKITRRFILILYNSFVFWNSYGKKRETHKEKYAVTNVLDEWILAELQELIRVVTDKLEHYKIGEAGRKIESFIDDLSRWYIRRSRARFQSAAKGTASNEADWEAASFTLQTVLLEVSKLVAPFMPFFAEALYHSLGGEKESVHLEKWPTGEGALANKALRENMQVIRQIAQQALALRAEHKIKVRQPLATLTLKKRTLEKNIPLLAILKDEVNVKEIEFNEGLADALELDLTITPALKEEGIVRELIRTVQGLRQDANLEVKNEIALMLEGPDTLTTLIQRHAVFIKKAVGARQLDIKRSEKFDAEYKGKLDEWEIWVAVRKL